MKTFEDFTGLYSLSKTLRFELKPIGETLHHIEKKGLLEDDKHRSESYALVKKIIDEYHKVFIDNALCDFELKFDDDNRKDSLAEFYFYYNLPQKEETEKKAFEEVQTKLRKQIANQLTSDEQFKRIDKKELIKEDLVNFVKNDEERKLISEFTNFTTYFSGFNQNRQNMYSEEAKSTSIAYRLIHQNLPKFIDNIAVFEKVAQTSVAKEFDKLYTEMEEYLNVAKIADIFRLQYYSVVMTQKQIEVYNSIIGGKTKNNGEKIQGLNEYINLYNQQQKEKNLRLPKLKPLFKQILSDRVAISWLPEAFSNDGETLENIQKIYLEINTLVLNRNEEGEHSLKVLLMHINEFDLNKIYIRNDLQLTDISQKLFGNWSEIQKTIEIYLQQNHPQKPKEDNEKYNERISKMAKSYDSFSIGFLNNCLQNAGKTERIENHFTSLGAVNTATEQKENLFARIENAYTDAKELLTKTYTDEKNLAQEKTDVEKIKNLLDAIKDLQHFIKPLLGKSEEQANKDENFYGEFTALWENLDLITPLYNMVRNYMTRKPYSEEKIKLNFENSTLLDGWDVNKETDNTSVIMRKGGLYYLAIMDKKHNQVFKTAKKTSDEKCFEKMDYKLLPGANKMLPKVFFSKSRMDEFKPSENILSNYAKETHKKGVNFNINDCRNLIDFYKQSINKHEDWKNFGFQFSDTSNYEDLSGFYREVEQQGYKVTFSNISESYVNQLVDEGKLYLFQIYNKDFSTYSKGTPNMHTLYWKMLFDEKNLVNVIYKLNGQAEVFFRKSSIKERNKIVHTANKPLINKNNLNEKKQSEFEYDIVKDRRYTIDKFQFHVPITINFKSAGQDNINPKVNNYIRENDDFHIIGIDRGERHLLYLTVIDMQGNIKEQLSLNEIINQHNGNNYRTNYRNLLDSRETERDSARKSWQTIEYIKELKEGYLSQVVHKITQLMIQYKAIVVLEDLNMGFMRGRQKVEKQVYQKFEKMLIDKLNYLVDKKQIVDQTGGILKAYQLTSKFESFQKLGKQSGFLFYVPAWNTSKMDPVTGFVNLFDTRYENVEKTKLFFSKFERIEFNSGKNQFEFTFDYSKFTAKAEGTRTLWTLCTQGTRVKTYRNPLKNSQFDSEEFDLTNAFNNLFAEYGIHIQNNLKDAVVMQTEKGFFEKLLALLKFTLQIRNSFTNSDIDYLISPVADENGTFYDSRTCNETLPKNADANGAYNIARKGIWVIQQIKQTSDDKKLKLAISNKEWLKFVQ